MAHVNHLSKSYVFAENKTSYFSFAPPLANCGALSSQLAKAKFMLRDSQLIRIQSASLCILRPETNPPGKSSPCNLRPETNPPGNSIPLGTTVLGGMQRWRSPTKEQKTSILWIQESTSALGPSSINGNYNYTKPAEATPPTHVDKHASRPKEFGRTSSAAPRRLNDIAQSPSELSSFARKKSSSTNTNRPVGKAGGKSTKASILSPGMSRGRLRHAEAFSALPGEGGREKAGAVVEGEAEAEVARGREVWERAHTVPKRNERWVDAYVGLAGTGRERRIPFHSSQCNAMRCDMEDSGFGIQKRCCVGFRSGGRSGTVSLARAFAPSFDAARKDLLIEIVPREANSMMHGSKLPDMYDDVTVPIVLGALSLLPDNRYILLALASALVVVNIANAQRPTPKLERTKHAINACKELLEGAKLICPRDHVELTERARRLSEVAMSASRIQVRLLEKHPDFTTWKGCVEYVKDMHDIWKKIHQCAKDVKEIETSMLLTIEAEKQRKSGENIRDCDEICDALGSQASARTSTTSSGAGAGHGKYYRIVRGIGVRINRNSSLETAFPAQSACFASCSVESNPRNSSSHWKESERECVPGGILVGKTGNTVRDE
ncbi:hypothetical protein DFH08DRAFT_944590 [Mycena albidolilacea]|uniref:Uncharacterized protein n=1 Tax=Mycena albidolilacea TaxID=1033008 RepID=A0AAD6Z4I2_9AGAR|nr:hypothetical protein DFH08DRAFT_944590 [Mycena albidolilacea]